MLRNVSFRDCIRISCSLRAHGAAVQSVKAVLCSTPGLEEHIINLLLVDQQLTQTLPTAGDIREQAASRYSEHASLAVS